MEREIKFRAWDGDKMHNVIYYKGGKRCVVPLKRFPGQEEIIVESIMQFTGLLDKNGVEIYEGDCVIANGWKLVKTHDYSNARRYVSCTIRDTYDSIYGRYEFICYWNDCFSQFNFKGINKNEAIASDVSDRDYEIIGNIHTK